MTRTPFYSARIPAKVHREDGKLTTVRQIPKEFQRTLRECTLRWLNSGGEYKEGAIIRLDLAYQHHYHRSRNNEPTPMQIMALCVYSEDPERLWWPWKSKDVKEVLVSVRKHTNNAAVPCIELNAWYLQDIQS